MITEKQFHAADKKYNPAHSEWKKDCWQQEK